MVLSQDSLEYLRASEIFLKTEATDILIQLKTNSKNC